MNSKNENETKNIGAAMIIDIIGKPPEHLIETLEAIIKSIDEEKGVKIINKKIKEPVLMEGQKEFYTTFAEVEVEVEEILYLAILMFKYMPAHIEIIYPELIALTNCGWNDIFNELTRRLHGYDEVARILQAEKSILEQKLRQVIGGKVSEIKLEPKTEKVKPIKKSRKKISKK